MLYWRLKHINLMFRIWRRWRVMCFACMTPIQMVFRFWKTISTKIVLYCIHTLYFSILVRKHIIWVCKKCAKKCVNLRQNSNNRPHFRNLYAIKYASLKKVPAWLWVSGVISMEEFLLVFHVLSNGTPEENLQVCEYACVCVCLCNIPNKRKTYSSVYLHVFKCVFVCVYVFFL